MRVQDIHGRWFEIDDALLAQCEVKTGAEPRAAKAPPASPAGPAPGEEEKADPSPC